MVASQCSTNTRAALFCYVSDGVRTVARAEQRVIYVIAKQERKKGRFAFVYGLLLLYCT